MKKERVMAINGLFRSRRISIEIIEMLIGVIEAGDSNLDGHSLHVHNLTMLLYDYLPLSYKTRKDRDIPSF